MRPVFLEGRALHIFPCRADKRPTTPHGFKDAVADAEGVARLSSLYPGPLIGVATGVISGIDVIDVDLRNGGDKWFHQHRDRIAVTRIHETQGGGWHLIFRHTPGFRCSNGRIAPGVDTKGDGGYIIWWPAVSGRVLCDGPVASWPSWLTFGEECTLRAVHEIVPTQRAHLSPTINLSRRTQQILRKVEQAKPGTRNDRLYWAACRLGEIMTEGRLQFGVAEQLLKSAAQICGLVRDDGARAVTATILSGLRRGSHG